MIHTINNLIQALLFQAHLWLIYWVEALHVAVHLLNINLYFTIHNQIPFTLLFNKQSTYDHLRVFGCLSFSNLNHSNFDKLSPWTTSPCLFLGYPSQLRGYMSWSKNQKIIISRNVYFDEEKFPAAVTHDNGDNAYRFLENIEEPGPSSLISTSKFSAKHSS